jgi:hypothetical protein
MFTEQKPKMGFAGFFGCDLHFMDKISFAFGFLSFPDIGANRSARTK